MTLTQLQKDIQRLAFNDGQISLIDCLMKDSEFLWQNIEELEKFLLSWRQNRRLENHIIETKYEELKK
jgi:hypothetical protein